MYRGSSFLLQKDYKVHIPVVREILKKKYNSLFGIKCSELKNDKNLVLLKELIDYIKKYYSKIRKDTKKPEIKADISFTLITKILIGTMGCIPAYDRYFIDGIKSQKVVTKNYENMSSILQLIDFYEKNESKLELIRNEMKIDNNLLYPQMKILDMGFWQIGLDLNKKS